MFISPSDIPQSTKPSHILTGWVNLTMGRLQLQDTPDKRSLILQWDASFCPQRFGDKQSSRGQTWLRCRSSAFPCIVDSTAFSTSLCSKQALGRWPSFWICCFTVLNVQITATRIKRMAPVRTRFSKGRHSVNDNPL